MTEEFRITPTRPYLVRAIYQWLEDNEFTPYLMVDATHKDAKLPTEYVQDGRIVLNIANKATGNLTMENDFIHFNARFGGVSQDIWVPLPAILGIYAKENHEQGLFFDPKEYDNYKPTESTDKRDTTIKKSRTKRKNTAGLKIIK